MNPPVAARLIDFLHVLSPDDFRSNLHTMVNSFGDRCAFSTSFSPEDQLITHWIFTDELPVRVFTLDTGRLFPETYNVWSRTVEKYQKPIHAYYPEAEAVSDFVTRTGPNSFYASVENRKECCAIRKVAPLKKALHGAELWITGIRAGQSANRQDMTPVEWDESNGLFKFHPLFQASEEWVRREIKEAGIPYNVLFDRGFPSVGCAPCTRAVKPGEDSRAGRWWWESPNSKECGLHEKKISG
jgi:phosphoadenosine phosphosulfate reductase